MSFAEYNASQYYVINDIVREGNISYSCIQANGPLTPQLPSASPAYWSPIPTGTGLSAVNSGIGSGIITSNAGGIGTISANLIGAAPISITPSGVDSSITIGFQAPTVVYGGFYSQTSQVMTAGSPVPFTYDATSGQNGVIEVGAYPTSQLRVQQSGIYRILFSIQWDKFGGGGADTVQAWLRTSGVGDVPWTNTELTMTQQINQVMTVEIVQSLFANEIIEIIGYIPVGAVDCQALANPVDATHPVAIPSIITNIEKLS